MVGRLLSLVRGRHSVAKGPVGVTGLSVTDGVVAARTDWACKRCGLVSNPRMESVVSVSEEARTDGRTVMSVLLLLRAVV